MAADLLAAAATALLDERRPLQPRRAGRPGRAAGRGGARAGRPGPPGAPGLVRARRWRSRASSRPRPAAARRTAGSAASRPGSPRRCGPRPCSTSTSCWPRPRRRPGSGRRSSASSLALRGPDERTLARVIEAVPLIRERTGLNVAASLGILTAEQARRLAAAGLHRYNHNLETARSFFAEVVTTHTWEERVDTCRLVRDAGMELCCGVLLGMGETDDQRLELLGQLRDVDPAEVPVNFLNPRPGHADGRPAPGRAAGGHPLDRPVPPGPARRDPALRRRPGGHPAPAPGPGPHVGHQRPDRRQLPHHPRPCRPRTTSTCWPTSACRWGRSPRCCERLHAAAHCTGCGRPSAECAGGCTSDLDPPRFCAAVRPAAGRAGLPRPTSSSRCPAGTSVTSPSERPRAA